MKFSIVFADDSIFLLSSYTFKNTSLIDISNQEEILLLQFNHEFFHFLSLTGLTPGEDMINSNIDASMFLFAPIKNLRDHIDWDFITSIVRKEHLCNRKSEYVYAELLRSYYRILRCTETYPDDFFNSMEGKKENTFTYREFFQRKFGYNIIGEQALIELEVGAKNKRNKLMIPQECVKYVDERLIHLRSVDFESIHQVLVKVHSEIFFNWKSISITNCFKFLSTDHARLRYIGDALLDCYVLKKLINLHPNADKNFIENQRMKIVNNVNLERCYSDLKLSVMFDLVNGDIRQFIYQSFAFKTSKYSKEIYKAFRPKQVCSPSKKVSSDIVEALLAYFFIHENDEQCLRLLSNITRLKEESFIASETSVLTHSANFEYLGKYVINAYVAYNLKDSLCLPHKEIIDKNLIRKAYLDFGSCLKRNEEQTRIYFGKLFSKNDLIKVFREMQNMVQK